MDKWILIAACVLAIIAAVQGALCVHFGKRSRWTVVWLASSFLGQSAVLGMRAQMRGSCPLMDTGEILLFSAWSLTLCYLAVGSVYRLSLLGVFTAPLVAFLLGLALSPDMMEISPDSGGSTGVWRAFHVGFTVLSYGALGLSSVAAAMFLVLNRQLKDAHLTTGLFKKLPPAKDLIAVVERLLILGVSVLTLGVISGVMMSSMIESSGSKHLIVAIILWVSYSALLVVTKWRGLPARRLALASISLFVLSLFIFLVL